MQSQISNILSLSTLLCQRNCSSRDLVEALSRLHRADRVALYVFHPDESGHIQISLNASYIRGDFTDHDTRKGVFGYPLQKNHPGWVEMLQKGSMISGCRREFQAMDSLFLERESLEYIMLVPIMSQGSCIGFLEFGSFLDETPPWSREEHTLLRLYATLLGVNLTRSSPDASCREMQPDRDAFAKLFRLLADTSPDLLWAKDLQGRYLFVNKAICTHLLCAQDVEEPIGKTDLFFANRERARYPDRMDWHSFGELCVNSDQEVIECRKPMRFEEYGNIRGEFVFLDVYKAPLFDGQGALIGTVGSGRIVTREKRIEQQLIHSEKLFRSLAETSPDLIFRLNRRAHVVYCSPSIETLLGYREQEVLGGHYLDVIAPRDRKRASSFVTDFFRKTGRGSLEVRMLHRRGDEVWCEIHVATCDLTGGEKGLQGVIRDITKRKQQEMELRMINDQLEQRVRQVTRQLIHSEKMNAVGTLSSSIAHEFNNPLCGIIHVLERVRLKKTLSTQEEELVELALRECERMKKLVLSLQSFEGMSNGKMIFLDVQSLLDEVLRLNRSRLESQGIHLLRKGWELDLHVFGVKDQLQQVLIHVLNNAIEAMSEDGGSLRVETGLENNHIVISITDTGVGISEQDIDHIFEPFFTTGPEVSETGLGLAVSYGIIQSHDGEIKVSSTPGEETTFSIYLPSCIEKGR